MLSPSKVDFSANLGFLFTEYSLTDAVSIVVNSGFTAVECHWPFKNSPTELGSACADVGVQLLGLNTWCGDVENGEFVLSALPNSIDVARDEIDRALDYAKLSGASAVHVMVGRFGDMDTFASNLTYATDQAAPHNITILIEPLNNRDVSDYLLTDLSVAMGLQDRIGAENLKIMFDCYHLQIMGGDLLKRARGALDRIGHIQIAASGNRGEPDAGEIDYRWLIPALLDAGYQGHIGAEYKPRFGDTISGLGWLDSFRRVIP